MPKVNQTQAIYGKGSKRRPESYRRVRDNWDAIDWRREKKIKRFKSRLP